MEMQFKKGAVTSSSSAAIAAANAAQLPLLILEAIPEWTPETLFLGAKRKYGQVGVMTTRRAAMSGVAGPVGAREVTNTRSRLLVSAFTPAELKAAAAVPIQRRFFDLEEEVYVTAKVWRKLPKDERVLIDGGGAAAKGAWTVSWHPDSAASRSGTPWRARPPWCRAVSGPARQLLLRLLRRRHSPLRPPAPSLRSEQVHDCGLLVHVGRGRRVRVQAHQAAPQGLLCRG